MPQSIMTRDVVTISPDATVREAADLLSKHAISAAPVCDEAGALLGIVSEGDLMRPFGSANSLRRNWWLDVLAEGEELAPDFVAYVAADNRRVRDLMTQASCSPRPSGRRSRNWLS